MGNDRGRAAVFSTSSRSEHQFGWCADLGNRKRAESGRCYRGAVRREKNPLLSGLGDERRCGQEKSGGREVGGAGVPLEKLSAARWRDRDHRRIEPPPLAPP